jgi:hypothetical protein
MLFKKFSSDSKEKKFAVLVDLKRKKKDCLQVFLNYNETKFLYSLNFQDKNTLLEKSQFCRLLFCIYCLKIRIITEFQFFQQYLQNF